MRKKGGTFGRQKRHLENLPILLSFEPKFESGITKECGGLDFSFTL